MRAHKTSFDDVLKTSLLRRSKNKVFSFLTNQFIILSIYTYFNEHTFYNYIK
jgi:hypothetical protein